MLDVMRRANRNKFFIGLIVMGVVAAFVFSVFAIWGGAANINDPGGFGWALKINGTEVPVVDLERERQQVQQALLNGPSADLYQGAPPTYFYEVAAQRILGQTLAYDYASTLGLSATDDEISRTIVTAPIFQRNGQFIGTEQYVKELTTRGFNVAEYEGRIGRELVIGKLEDAVGSMVDITEDEIEQVYQDEGVTAEVDYVMISNAAYTSDSEPAESDLTGFYEQNRDDYKTSERRKVTYVLIKREPLFDAVETTDQEIQDSYNQNASTYTLPEQRRASHILFEVLPESSAEEIESIRERAQQVLDQARAGGDFAQLARENSTDQVSAAAGGDLGWFGRERMVPEFSTAAFNLSEGEISDLVQSQFGFHIITTTGSREAGLQPIEEVRDEITRSLSFRKVQELLQEKANEFRTKLDQQVSSLEGTAGELGHLAVQTGFFSRDEPMGDLGNQPRAGEEVFRLAVGDVSPTIPVGQGILFVRLDEVKESEPATFEQARDEILNGYKDQAARIEARKTAQSIIDAGFEGFKQSADDAKLPIGSTGEFSRASAPDAFSDAVNDAIFASPADTLVGPIDTDTGVAVVKVFKRGPETDDDAVRIRTDLAEVLLETKRREAYASLLQSLMRSSTFEQNQPLFDELARQSAPQ